MLVPRDVIERELRFERTALAQETAQQRVHVPFCGPLLERWACLHRLVDHGVLAVALALQRIERAPKQRLDEPVRRAALRKRSQDGLHATIAAKRAVRQVDEGSARTGRTDGPGARQFF